MPVDSAGNVTRPPSPIPVSGQNADAPQVNVPIDDIYAVLNLLGFLDGRKPLLGPINLNGYRVQNAADAVGDQDYVTLAQAGEMISAAVGSIVAPDTYVEAGGTANALTGTLNPPIVGYGAGLWLTVKATSTNTGAVTLNLNGLGARAVVTVAGAPLVAGQIIAGQVFLVVDDGTRFQILNPVPIVVSPTSYRLIREVVFTSSGTYTPHADCVYIEVEGCGAGAGGGAASTGNLDSSAGVGGGGAGAFGFYSSASPVTTTVTIGAPGSGATGTGSDGGNGGQTSFGSLLVLGGGLGGRSLAGGNDNRATSGGDGGTPTAGSRTSKGQPGNPGTAGSVSASSKLAVGGPGGGGPYGSGGFCPVASSGTGQNGGNASGRGAGGAGAAARNSSGSVFNGGNGTGGIIIIREYARV